MFSTISSYQCAPSKTSWNGFHISISVMLWHVSAWNMILWRDFKACRRLMWASWDVVVARNDMGDLIWGMWLSLDWGGVGWVAPPKINDHILSNGIFMHALECEMHQWKDVDIFCRKRNGWVHINAFLMYIWHYDDRRHPQTALYFVSIWMNLILFIVNLPNTVMTKMH